MEKRETVQRKHRVADEFKKSKGNSRRKTEGSGWCELSEGNGIGRTEGSGLREGSEQRTGHGVGGATLST